MANNFLRSNFLKRPNFFNLASLPLGALVVVSLDQLSKYVLGCHLLNAGVSLSWLQAWPSTSGLVVLSWLVFGLLVIKTWLTDSKNISWIQKTALLLIWSGGGSNLIDRWWRGGVCDIWRLTVGVWQISNNLADWLIFMGVVLWIGWLLRPLLNKIRSSLFRFFYRQR